MLVGQNIIYMTLDSVKKEKAQLFLIKENFSGHELINILSNV